MSKRIRTRIPKTETITARKSKPQRDYPALRFIRFGLWDGSEKIAGCCKYLYFEMFRDPADGLVHEVLIRDVYGFGFFNGKYW